MIFNCLQFINLFHLHSFIAFTLSKLNAVCLFVLIRMEEKRLKCAAVAAVCQLYCYDQFLYSSLCSVSTLFT